LTDQARRGVINLGASFFFFKRGEGDRGNASRFFSTNTRDLVLKVPGLDRLVAEVIASDPTVLARRWGAIREIDLSAVTKSNTHST
jgi:hypothetical protein